VWSPDWGNVPAWLGAGSLLLAFRIFLRDRGTRERAQVEGVGIWWENYRELPQVGGSGPRVDDAKIRISIRNASDLPVEATQIAWQIHTRWGVPDPQPGWPGDGPGAWQVVNGNPDTMRFIGPVEVPPQTTWEGEWLPVNLTHTAPENADWLDFTSEGLRCALSYALITDNAGRRWETRHQKGKQARRIRWYSRSGPYYPIAWQNPVGRRARALKAKMTRKRKAVEQGDPQVRA
jgi:hypothetical protein